MRKLFRFMVGLYAVLTAILMTALTVMLLVEPDMFVEVMHVLN